jgi:hypothetical protein
VKGGYFDYKSKRNIIFDEKDADEITLREGKIDGEEIEIVSNKDHEQEAISVVSNEEILSIMGLILPGAEKSSLYICIYIFIFT